MLKVKLNFKVGDTFQIPIMGGFHNTRIDAIEFRVDFNICVDDESYYISYRDAQGNVNLTHYKHLNLPLNVNEQYIDPNFKLGEVGLVLHDYMGGAELKEEKVTGYSARIGDWPHLNYITNSGMNYSYAIFKDAEECIKFLTRKIKK